MHTHFEEHYSNIVGLITHILYKLTFLLLDIYIKKFSSMYPRRCEQIFIAIKFINKRNEKIAYILIIILEY